MIARFQVEQHKDREDEDKDEELSVKAFRLMKGKYDKDERKPLWRNRAEVIRRSKEALKTKKEKLRKEAEVKEKEQAAKNSSSCYETYADKEDVIQPKKGTKIPTATLVRKPKQTEERRKIPVLQSSKI